MTVLLHFFGVLSCLLDQTLGLFLLWLVIQPDPNLLPKRYYWFTALLYSAVCIVLTFSPLHNLIKISILFLLILFSCWSMSGGKIGVSLFLAMFSYASIFACKSAEHFLFSALSPHLSLYAIADSAFVSAFSILSSRSLHYFLWGLGILLFYRRKQPASPSATYAPQWIILCASIGLLTSFGIALQWMAKSHMENIIPILGVFPVVFPTVVILVFLLSASLSHEVGCKYRLQSELLHAEQQLEQQKAVESMYEQIRGMQHDFRNHMQIIGALAEQQQGAEVSAYIRDIAGQFPVGKALIHTGILAIDSMMNSKFIHAQKQGIDIFAEVYFPEPLVISVPDLCTALFNMLDNAIEACEKNQTPAKRHIRFDLYQHEHFLVVRCCNPSETQPISHKCSFRTTKTGDLHGIGIRQLQRIAEKYHGFFHAVYDDGIFTAKLALSHKVRIQKIHVSNIRPEMQEYVPHLTDEAILK